MAQTKETTLVDGTVQTVIEKRYKDGVLDTQSVRVWTKEGLQKQIENSTAKISEYNAMIALFTK